MRSRPSTLAFRKIQFHRGNPESPVNWESAVAEKFNEIAKRTYDEDDQEPIEGDGNFSEEDAIASSLEHE